MSAGPARLGRLAIEEVRLCHAFFEDRFAGRADPDATALRLAAFSPEFRRIAPDGGVVAYADLRAFLETRSAEEAGTGLAIRIEETAVVWENADAALVSYVEHQTSRSATSRRHATALFTAAPHSPAGVQWRHLQETLIPSPRTGGECPRPSP
ncbi:hypothetical protein NPA31_009640 [Aurantimonas sp. MSK8Z-1]|uniref:hypothetical protein n=1 Tax=Mangrovibrevibacter kandeliae TaxID=2968473 RepID=UPI0021196DF1|nr:hypothetical protein [Aurantimonas sp. MSK8Z-1]MCW4115219.1 hypothetical protein [Aurantimonas sp. MSK8Z-1]